MCAMSSGSSKSTCFTSVLCSGGQKHACFTSVLWSGGARAVQWYAFSPCLTRKRALWTQRKPSTSERKLYFPYACRGKGIFSGRLRLMPEACKGLGRSQARKASKLDVFKLFSTRIRSSSQTCALRITWVRTRWRPEGVLIPAFPPACRRKGRLMDLVRACDRLFPLPEGEKSIARGQS